MGDLVDSIHEKDKRYSEAEVADWCVGTKRNIAKWGGSLIDRQFRYALHKLRPLVNKGKILWWHEGNHEHKLVTTASRDLTRDWARSSGVPYAGLAALSQLIVRSAGGQKGGRDGKQLGSCKRVTFFTTHGGGASQTHGAVANRVAGMLNAYDVDVAIMAHLHRKMHIPQTMHTITSNGRRKIRERIAAVCGTFLDGHAVGINSYAELKGYTPLPLGSIVVHIRRRPGLAATKDDPLRSTDYTHIWVSDGMRAKEGNE